MVTISRQHALAACCSRGWRRHIVGCSGAFAPSYTPRQVCANHISFIGSDHAERVSLHSHLRSVSMTSVSSSCRAATSVQQHQGPTADAASPSARRAASSSGNNATCPGWRLTVQKQTMTRLWCSLTAEAHLQLCGSCRHHTSRLRPQSQPRRRLSRWQAHSVLMGSTSCNRQRSQHLRIQRQMGRCRLPSPCT